MISIYKSPLGPPLTPRSPLPLNLNCSPSFVPAGISIVIVLCTFTLPFPLQVEHVLLNVLPVPLQDVQVALV